MPQTIDTTTNFPEIYTTQDTLGNLTGSWRYLRPEIAAKSSPCMAACPAGNPISTFIALASAGNFPAALRAIKSENPLPSVCGRVCPHPCASSCARAGFDSHIAINEIERFTGDTAAEHGLCLPDPAPPTGRKIAVIGSGPAGLSCAYQCALSGHSVTIFESAANAGGMLRAGIPAYRLPRAALDSDLAFIDALGIVLNTSYPVDKTQFKQILDGFDAVCVSTGAHESRRLAIEGEDNPRVVPGLQFLRQLNEGAATPRPGKNVIVIGGGNTAVDAARCALRLGAGATIVYRRTRGEMPAFEDEVREAEEEGVEFRFLAAPVKIEHRPDCPAVTFTGMRPGAPDESGRARPEPVSGTAFTLEADTVITAIGETASCNFDDYFTDISGVGGVPGGSGGSVRGWGRTSSEKIFLCGDAGPNERTVAHAIGSGKRAAIAIDVFLRGDKTDTSRLALPGAAGAVSAAMYRALIAGGGFPPPLVADARRVNMAYFRRETPFDKTKLLPGNRITGFGEVSPPPERDAVTREAAKCFSCGSCTECANCALFCPEMSIRKDPGAPAPEFDADYCKGCGICARECPRGVIEMVEDEK